MAICAQVRVNVGVEQAKMLQESPLASKVLKQFARARQPIQCTKKPSWPEKTWANMVLTHYSFMR
jgi:hypothetical protein